MNLQLFQEFTGTLQQLIATNARKRSIILTFYSTSSHAVEKQRQFTKVISCFQDLVFWFLIKVPMVNDACANCNEVKVFAFVSLLNYNVVGFAHLGDQIANHFLYLFGMIL